MGESLHPGFAVAGVYHDVAVNPLLMGEGEIESDGEVHDPFIVPVVRK